MAEFYKDRKNHIITTVTEHKCVLDTCRHLEQQGFEVTYLPVQQNGLLDLDVLRAAITDKTVLVSVMAVNNEIGVIQPLAEIGKICRERKVFFHTDAAQAAGKIPLDVEAMNIDLSEHLGSQDLRPQGHRRALRPPQAARAAGRHDLWRWPGARLPFWHAADAALRWAGRGLRDRDEGDGRRGQAPGQAPGAHAEGLRAKLTDIVVNGDLEQRIPGNLNISFAYVEGESLMMGIKNLSVSSGSACTSASLEPSYVLRALGVEEEMAHTSLRIGLGPLHDRA